MGLHRASLITILLLSQPKKAENCNHDHHCADHVNDAVHEPTPIKFEYEGCIGQSIENH